MSFNLTDESIMRWGVEHYGKQLKNVPADYLLWILETWGDIPQRLHVYLVENYEALTQEADEKGRRKFN